MFVVEEVPHGQFKRDGDNLEITVEVDLLHALVGFRAKVPTLDGRVVALPIREVVETGSTRIISGEGMPRKAGGKGDLRVKFKVNFPKTVSSQQADLLRQALGNGAS